MSYEPEQCEVEREHEQTLQTERIVTKRQLSGILHVSERLIEFEMAAGRLPYLKVGRRAVRFDLPAVLESLRNRE